MTFKIAKEQDKSVSHFCYETLSYVILSDLLEEISYNHISLVSVVDLKNLMFKPCIIDMTTSVTFAEGIKSFCDVKVMVSRFPMQLIPFQWPAQSTQGQWQILFSVQVTENKGIIYLNYWCERGLRKSGNVWRIWHKCLFSFLLSPALFWFCRHGFDSTRYMHESFQNMNNTCSLIVVPEGYAGYSRLIALSEWSINWAINLQLPVDYETLTSSYCHVD